MQEDVRSLYYYYTRIYRTERNEYTQKCADYYFNKYVMPYIGEKDLSSIRSSEMQLVINNLRGKAQTTIAIVYGDLMLIVKRAYLDGIIDKDYSGMLLRPKAKTTETRRALTAKEREAVIAVAQTKRKYYAYLLMILCGARPSEAFAVEKEDIDFDRELVHIRGTKTTISDRFVPCPRIILKLAEKTLTGALSVSETGLKVTREIQRTTWKAFWIDCHKYLGGKMYRNAPVEPFPFGKDLTAYNLRHEYCTELARNGIDLRITQKLMGHSSPEMTLKVYTNLTSDDLDTEDVRKVINKIPG